MVKYLMILLIITMGGAFTVNADTNSSNLEIQVYLHEDKLDYPERRMYLDLRNFSEQDISRFTEMIKDWLKNEAFEGHATEKFHIKFLHTSTVTNDSGEEHLTREE